MQTTDDNGTEQTRQDAQLAKKIHARLSELQLLLESMEAEYESLMDQLTQLEQGKPSEDAFVGYDEGAASP